VVPQPALAVSPTPAPADLDDPDQARLRQLGRKVRRRLEADKRVQRIGVDKAEIWAVTGFFDPIECGRLIPIIDLTATPSFAHGDDYAKGLRTSYSGDVHPDDPFIRTIQQRIDDLLGIDPAFGETIQGQRYTVGQQFSPHTDWFPPGSDLWRVEHGFGGQRAFTTMAYLNDVEAGGETDFPHLDIAIRPRAGTLLVWNNLDENGLPNPYTVHAGNPVTRGVKYIVTKWYRSRRWQPHEHESG
jgi:prolyl 4-hydroxylase